MDFPLLYMTWVTPDLFLGSEDVRSMDGLKHLCIKHFPQTFVEY